MKCATGRRTGGIGHFPLQDYPLPGDKWVGSRHGSVVAREFGIPAVESVKEATNLIRTCDRIRIDDAAGYVKILERNAS